MALKPIVAIAIAATLTLVTTNLHARVATRYNNIHFNQLPVDDKLPNNTIQSITQDKYGYMWFGTKSGLCRYDGYDLTIYNHDGDNETSLSNNVINKIYNDPHSGRIWISTEGGVNCYDHTNDCFLRCPIEKNSRYDIKFTSTNGGDLLVNSSSGVYRFDEGEMRFVPYLSIGEMSHSVDRVECDKSNRLWIKSASNLLCYDNSLKMFVALPHALNQIKDDCRKLIITSNSQLIIRCTDAIWGYNIENDRLYRINFSDNTTTFNCVEVDRSNNLWFGTEKGIFVLNENYREIKHFVSRAEELSNINDTSTYSIFRDRDDNIWVGTSNGGVNYYIAGTDLFHNHKYGNTKNHLSGRVINSIINDARGGVYIASEGGGVDHINRWGRLTRDEVLCERFQIAKGQNVRSLLLTEGRYLWIGTQRSGVVRYDSRTGESFDYNTLIPNISAFSLLEDSDGNVWCGGSTGLYKIDCRSFDSEPKKIGTVTAQCMLELDNRKVLIGSRRGALRILDLDTNIISLHDVLPKKDLYISHIYRDSHDRIWVGANNDKLYVLDGEGKLQDSYTKEELGSSDIKSIVEDNQNNIWVGSGNGLCCIEPQSRVVSRYSTANGLPTNQFNHAASCKRANGELMFGTINGMVSFIPHEIKHSEDRFDIVLSQIWSNAQEISPNTPDTPISSAVADLSELSLKYDQAQSFSIHYAALNYQYGNQTQYSIKLDGVDDDWQFVGKQHSVRFANLPAGDYTLRIKARSPGGEWDEEGALSLSICVTPPWWLSWWAYIIYFIVLSLLCWILIHYTRARLTLIMRLRSEQERRVNIELMNQQKSNFFSYVSHDLKTPLTLILTPLKQMIGATTQPRDQEQLKMIYRNASRVNHLIDEILSFSKIEMQQMQINLRKGDIMMFLRELSQIFSFVAAERDIEFVVELEDEARSVWFSPTNLERIIYNLLSNAFKYTPDGGRVELRARVAERDEGEIVVISVKDSGRGVAKELQPRIFDSYYQIDKRDQRTGFGLGLALTRSLVLLHKGEINLVSEPGCGAEFIVTLNVSNSSFEASAYSNECITADEIDGINYRLEESINLNSDQVSESGFGGDLPTILIVEDSRDMNNYIASIFAGEYELMRAYNGVQALQMIVSRLPDLIISDVMMPQMDGLEFTSKIKEDRNTSHIPVVLITAKSEEQNQTEGYTVGADAYISKPFNAKNLKLLIANLQRSRQHNIDRFSKSQVIDVDIVATNTTDNDFMRDLVSIITSNLSNESFGVTDVLEHMHISRTLLHTKMKALCGVTFTQLVRSIKMREAKSRLEAGCSVAEVSFMVGISDPSYLTKCFKKEFNMTPSDFLRERNIQKREEISN